MAALKIHNHLKKSSPCVKRQELFVFSCSILLLGMDQSVPNKESEVHRVSAILLSYCGYCTYMYILLKSNRKLKLEAVRAVNGARLGEICLCDELTPSPTHAVLLATSSSGSDDPAFDPSMSLLWTLKTIEYFLLHRTLRSG